MALVTKHLKSMLESGSIKIDKVYCFLSGFCFKVLDLDVQDSADYLMDNLCCLPMVVVQWRWWWCGSVNGGGRGLMREREEG
ncbi:hypothetical protein Hanom_Chr04g00373191 [Helianthus anomalus]